MNENILENDNISFSVSDYGATLVEFIHKKTGTDSGQRTAFTKTHIRYQSN